MNNIEAKVPDELVAGILEIIAKPEIQTAENADALTESMRTELGILFTNPVVLSKIGNFVAAQKNRLRKAAQTEPTQPETFERTGLYGIEDLKNLTDANLKEFATADIDALRSDLISVIGQKNATTALKGLASQGIITVSDLLDSSENDLVNLIRNFGPTHINGIVQVLAQKKLRMKR